jgi:hypothetical protein
MNRIERGEEFIVEKMTDIFLEVTFHYGERTWSGAVPKKLKYQGHDVDEISDEYLDLYYRQLEYSQREAWIEESKSKWGRREPATYRVFEALLSGEWECRTCGPAPKVNPQPAARIRSIKKWGVTVASKRRICQKCGSKQMHDILVMATLPEDAVAEKFRKPIPEAMRDRIIKVLDGIECVSGKRGTRRELVIDHKFPSQRWSEPESDNHGGMTDGEIRVKFQLLNNQTNMLKSRQCDHCVEHGKRGSFMEMQWYYEGDHLWRGNHGDSAGCKGCPWYDVMEWKAEVIRTLNLKG